MVAEAVLVLCGAALLGPSAAAQLPAPAPVDPEVLAQATGGNGRLSIAVRNIEPLATPDANGWAGYSVEFWEDAAGRLGIPCDYIEVASVAEQLDAVRSGRTDAALGAISITAEERRRSTSRSRCTTPACRS